VSSALDIVIPMAGRGSRFAKVGYQLPKPLIDVNGKPMIERVIDNLRPTFAHRFIFLVLQEHLENFQLAAKLREWAGANAVIVPVTTVTEGAACTVLLAKAHLSANDLIIANSDQLVDFSLTDYVSWSRESRAEGSILCFEDQDEKWSFAKLDAAGHVVEVAEKKRISNLATVGIYWFKRGADFVAAAESMIAKNIRTNNEFYVCPVYNEMIQLKKRIVTWKIEKQAMHGVGTPEDLETYLRATK
jgi:dTDP-glucose pyrophosphorylase